MLAEPSSQELFLIIFSRLVFYIFEVQLLALPTVLQQVQHKK